VSFSRSTVLHRINGIVQACDSLSLKVSLLQQSKQLPMALLTFVQDGWK